MSESEQSPVSRSKRASKADESKPTARAIIESAPGKSLSANGAPDDVFPSAVVYNPRKQKSVTLYHLQRRLEEVGYNDAAAAQTGLYDEHLRYAFESWQADNGHEVGAATAEQLEALFDGDPNVSVQAG